MAENIARHYNNLNQVHTLDNNQIEMNFRRLTAGRKLTILAIIVIVIMNSGYYLSNVYNNYIPLVVLMLMSVSFLYKQRPILPVNIYLLVLLLSIVLSSIVNYDTSNLLSGLRVGTTIFCAYLFTTNIDFDQFSIYYNKTLRFISCISLISYCYMIFAGDVNLPSVTALGGYEYYNLLITTSMKNVDLRNMSLFWEPGVFATALIYGLLMTIYMRPPKNTKKTIFLYGIVLLTTKSTAGIMIGVLILLGYLVKMLKINMFAKNILFIVVTLLVLFFYNRLFGWLAEINPEVFGKLFSDTRTTTNRFNSPMANIALFLQRPWFGYGFTTVAAEYITYCLNMFRISYAQTSTSTQLLSAIGIGGVAYTIGLIVGPFHRGNNSITGDTTVGLIDKVVIVTSLLLIVNKEPHVFILMSWIMFFYLTNRHSMRNQLHGTLYI